MEIRLSGNLIPVGEVLASGTGFPDFASGRRGKRNTGLFWMVSGAYFRPGNSHLSVLYVYQRKGTPQEAEEKGSRCGDRDFVSQSFYERMWCGCGTGEENVSYGTLAWMPQKKESVLPMGCRIFLRVRGREKRKKMGGSRVLADQWC